jgi:hypothetical protein
MVKLPISCTKMPTETRGAKMMRDYPQVSNRAEPMSRKKGGV